MSISPPIVLYTSPVLCHPPDGGPSLRVENSIKALSQVSRLHLYSQQPPRSIGGGVAVSFYRQFCIGFYQPPTLTLFQRSVNKMFSGLGKAKPFVSDEKSLLLYSDIVATARRIHADLIWLGYGNIAYPLLKYIKAHSSFRVVTDTDSVWSRFALRGADYASSSAERSRILKEGKDKETEERWGTALSDVTTAVSEVDASYYRFLANNKSQVHLFSNAIDVSSYSKKPEPAEGLRLPCVYLAGTFFSATSPMVDAANWLLNDVWPTVRIHRPDAHLFIVGRGSNSYIHPTDHASVTVIGGVPSVLPYLCHATVAVVPLRFESGTRFKILEAGACGTPVVSTTLGAEGLPAVHGRDLLIADEPEPFAEAILSLLNAPARGRELASNLKTIVTEKFGISALANEAGNILESLRRPNIR